MSLQKITLEDETLERDYSLKNLIRFNTSQRIKNESVAEHSYFVVYYTYIFCKNLNLSTELTNKCIMNAILHDVAEIEISDVPHNIKEKYPVVKHSLLEAEIDWYKEFHPEYLRDDAPCDIINLIVELADVYSVKQYCLNEVSLGNKKMREILKSAANRIVELQSKILKELQGEKNEL